MRLDALAATLFNNEFELLEVPNIQRSNVTVDNVGETGKLELFLFGKPIQIDAI